ncbi:MAG TPA: efflux transporter outer membrane subunit [Caulobacteraceae bacterium]|nr:efflux transporter outer membrane subunit [Caulobacteraceae bacterium]
MTEGRSNRTMALAGLMAGAAALAGCAVGPDYRPPIVETPPTFSATDASPPPDAWWTGFGDAELDRLTARALDQNLDVRAAAARIAEAREQTRIAGAEALPSLEAASAANTISISKHSGLSSLASAAGALSGAKSPGQGGASAFAGAGSPGLTIDTYQAGFDASWELDLFGGTRRQIEAARAREDAALWSLRDAQVMLAAEVARSYLHLRSLDQQTAVEQALTQARTDGVAFQKARQASGLTPTPELRAAERSLAAETAQRQDVTAQRVAEAHALAVLLGETPDALQAELAQPQPALADPSPAAVPTGLPSDLLLRRPDVRRAERDLAAATADVGAATADLYPKIALTGSDSLVSSALKTLVSSDSLQPSLGANLTLPIFEGGRLRATLKLRDAQAREAALAYRSAVLGALKDVEDALSRLQADQARAAQFALSAAAADDALAATRAQAHAGLIDGLALLDAQANALSAQSALIQARFAEQSDRVALNKALGGGWASAPAMAADLTQER